MFDLIRNFIRHPFAEGYSFHGFVKKNSRSKMKGLGEGVLQIPLTLQPV
jgi:hypothetical protein